MQSTKVDESLSLAARPTQNEVGGQYNLPTSMEKVLVVLLVAAATVCFLTNFLVLFILLRQNGRLTLRYQIMVSQAVVGVFSCVLAVYPLKMLSLILLDPNHSHSILSRQDAPFFTSEPICLLVCSFPLAVAILLALIHAVALLAEQTLYVMSIQRFMLITSSQKLISLIIFLLWIIPSGIVAVPGTVSHIWPGFCYLNDVWTRDFLGVLCGFLIVLILAFLILVVCVNRKRAPEPMDSVPILEAAAEVSVTVTEADCLTMRYRTSARRRRPRPVVFDIALSRSSALCFLSTLALSLPSLIHVAHRSEAELFTDLVASAEADHWLPWTHLLLLTAGALTPVLHLLTDEAVSSLALEAAKLIWCPMVRGIFVEEEERKRKFRNWEYDNVAMDCDE